MSRQVRSIGLAEEAFNQAIGQSLCLVNRRWNFTEPNPRIFVGSTGVIKDSAQLKPDILLVDSSFPPVCIESSYGKSDADKDAIARLGLRVAGTGDTINTCIALHIPESFREMPLAQTRESLMAGATFGYAVYQRYEHDGQQRNRRWVEHGFIEGTLFDLASLLESVALPKEVVDEIGFQVAQRIEQAANRLEGALNSQQLQDVTSKVLQRTPLKGVRTTMVLWLNAFLVQHHLNQSGVEGVEPLSFAEERPYPTRVAAQWRSILRRNWKAIFEPALEVLELATNVHIQSVSSALAYLMKAVEYIEVRGLGTQINICAEIFPRLSDDRKQAGAYYTQPPTAELLAHLTINREDLDDREWRNPALFKNFKLADLACGTGTLLRAGLLRIRRFHRETGGDLDSLKRLHQHAIETGIIGVDVSPIAAHLSNSSLVAIGYGDDYEHTRIGSCPVGGNESATGSIELFQHDRLTDMLHAIGGTVSGKGDETNSVYVQDLSMKWILMNPPYSKTTGRHGAFEIGGLSDVERRKCQERWGQLIRQEPATKRAGMAATFVVLAIQKLAIRGNMGFVLPLTSAHGPDWEETRRLIERCFQHITVLAVAGGEAVGTESLSADTNLEEMLLVCRNRMRTPSLSPAEPSIEQTIHCVTLFKSTTRSGESCEIAKAIEITSKNLDASSSQVSLPILVGDDSVGEITKLKVSGDGKPWFPVGVTQPELTRSTRNLTLGNLSFQDIEHKFGLDMSTLGDVFEIGYGENSIGYKHGSKPSVGPFEFIPIHRREDLYKQNLSLWEADSKQQDALKVQPTHYGVYSAAHTTEDEKRVETSKGFLHVQQGMRWTSQSILVASTEQKVHGGRAWRTLLNSDSRIRSAFALWANSTLGMIIYWSSGLRTQDGRTTIRTKATARVPCPSFDQLTSEQLDEVQANFEKLSTERLLPACQAHRDPVRKEIDVAVIRMLGLSKDAISELAKVRWLWCNEPSVHGNNKEALDGLDAKEDF